MNQNTKMLSGKGWDFFQRFLSLSKIVQLFSHIFQIHMRSSFNSDTSWQIMWKHVSVWNEHCRPSSLRWAFHCVNSVVDVHYQRSAKRWEFPNFKQILEHKVVLGQGNSIWVFLWNKSQCWLITVPRSLLPFLTRMKTFTYVWMFFQTNLSRQ